MPEFAARYRLRNSEGVRCAEHESLLPARFQLTPDARLTALNHAVCIVFKERALSHFRGTQQGGLPKGAKERGDSTSEVTGRREAWSETAIDPGRMEILAGQEALTDLTHTTSAGKGRGRGQYHTRYLVAAV